MPKEQYMCQLCANHGIFNQPKKGHKQKCPFRNCLCNSCGLNTKRRALDQIERKLRIKESPSPPVLEKQTTLITAPYTKPHFKESSETSIGVISNIPPSHSTNLPSFVSLQPTTNTTSLLTFSVPLPSTIPIFPPKNMKSDLSNIRLLKQPIEQKRNDNEMRETVRTNQSPYILRKEDGIENINKERRSIFHSVEMLTREET